MEPTQAENATATTATEATDATDATEASVLVTESLVEEVSIDGMCGVY